MIKKLTLKNQQQILDFCYKRERENLFVIGSFKNDKKPFSINKYYGYFQRGSLIGLATFFGKFGSFVINANRIKVLEALVDYGVREKLNIGCVPAFKKYAKGMIERFEKIHKKKPKKIMNDIVFILTKKTFRNFSAGIEEKGSKKDIDDIVKFDRKIGFSKEKGEIRSKERKKILHEHTFFMKMRNKIVSKANLHGYSKNYFQIGGVGTLEAFRGQGLAKKVVSKLCEYYFQKGIKYGLLFTGNDNIAAQKVYKSIGFKPIDKFVIAEYK
ncbi:GNAT family N-acetyltransferase [Candidatus Peregrinibacteria bacterium]|nr:GNAT family N-acetyltransferase [Candidatus Peregrinibacteria bacterium]